jgi:hypothetical protein
MTPHSLGFGATSFPPLKRKIDQQLGTSAVFSPAGFETAYDSPQSFVPTYAFELGVNLSPAMPYPFVQGQVWPIGL